MKDFLHTTLDTDELFEMSTTALAHIGDAVFELMVRASLCREGRRSAKTLHLETVRRVSASAQAAAAEVILPALDGDERGVFLRGRNAKVSSLPKSASPETYHTATALETLFGYLYLSGRYDRLNELFALIAE